MLGGDSWSKGHARAKTGPASTGPRFVLCPPGSTRSEALFSLRPNSSPYKCPNEGTVGRGHQDEQREPSRHHARTHAGALELRAFSGRDPVSGKPRQATLTFVGGERQLNATEPLGLILQPPEDGGAADADGADSGTGPGMGGGEGGGSGGGWIETSPGFGSRTVLTLTVPDWELGSHLRHRLEP
jgi:hypothetical protein